jgi:hypothetical protein
LSRKFNRREGRSRVTELEGICKSLMTATRKKL